MYFPGETEWHSLTDGDAGAARGFVGNQDAMKPFSDSLFPFHRDCTVYFVFE